MSIVLRHHAGGRTPLFRPTLLSNESTPISHLEASCRYLLTNRRLEPEQSPLPRQCFSTEMPTCAQTRPSLSFQRQNPGSARSAPRTSKLFATAEPLRQRLLLLHIGVRGRFKSHS